MRCLILFTILVALTACESSATVESSPADEIAWANEQIDVQRLTKRWLLIAEPIERQVEAHLNADPRVASARFAIDLKGWGTCGTSADTLFFTAVVHSRELMDDEAAMQLLDVACATAEASPNTWCRIDRDGSTWAISGFIDPAPRANPDLSVLARE